MNFTVSVVIIVFNLVLIECQLTFMERIISCVELFINKELDSRPLKIEL